MKTLTAAQKTARDADGHSVARIIKFEWPDSGTIYYTERGVTEIDPEAAKTFVPIVASFPQTARSVDLGVVDAGPFLNATFSLWIDPNDVQNIETRVDDENPTGATVTTYQVLRAAGALDDGEWSTLGKYQIESWVVVYQDGGNLVRFDCTDFSQSLGDKEIGRVITEDLYADAPTRSYGQMIPIIFGEVEESPCPLVTTGVRTTLDAILYDDDGVIEVAFADDFPAAGTILIDNEKISYTDKDDDPVNTIGTAGTPAVRGVDGTVATVHYFGAAVVEVPSTYRFIVADAVTEPPLTITGATNATPIVVTIVGHGYLVAETVFVEGVLGTTAANGFWAISAKTADTFTLFGSVGNGAYAGGGTASRIDIASIDNVKINGVQQVPVTDWNFNVINDGEEHVGVIEANSLPVISAAGVTTQLLLEDLDTPISWADGAGGATDPLDAVDTGDDKHVTYGYIEKNQSLIVTQDNDLSGNAGEIKSAKVYVEYQLDQTGGDVFPATPVEINIFEGAVEKVSKDLGDPADNDPTIFPTGAPADDSTDMFVATSGYSSLIANIGRKYVSGYAVNGVGVFCAYNITSWPYHNGMAVGSDPIKYIGGVNFTNSCLINIEVCFHDAGDTSSATTPLIVTPLYVPPDTIATLIKVDVVVYGIVNGPVAPGQVQIRLQCGGDDSGYQVFTQPAFETTTHCIVTLTGDYSTAEIQAATVAILGYSNYYVPGVSTPNARSRCMDFQILDIIWEAYGLSPILAGLDTPLEANVLSSRVRQEVDITSTVRTAGGWDFFDGTGANPLSVQVLYPDQVNTTIIRVYDISVQVEVLGGAGDILVTEDTAEMTADVGGYFGAASPKISSEETITRLLEDDDFYGLTGADHTGLAAAILDTTTDPVVDWRFDRRISAVQTLRELLRQAVTDAGIRYTMDSGRFIFYPHVYANNSDVDTGDNYTLSRSIMTSLPTKERTHIDLVRNQIAVYFRRAFTGALGFSRSRESDDTLSQAQAWGIRRETYGAEWVRDNDVAEALANRFVADFAQNRVMMQLTASAGRSLHWEVGDAVLLDDDYTRLTNLVGRIVGAAYVSAALQRFTLAVTDRRYRLFNHAASGSYIDYWAGMQRAECVVDGVKVAIMSVDGLRLKGELIEEAFDPEVSQTAQIEYDDTGENRIVISSFVTPDYFRVLEFRAGGDARVYQVSEEGTAYPTLTYSALPEDVVFFCGTDLETPGALTRAFLQLIEELVGGEENATMEIREVFESAV